MSDSHLKTRNTKIIPGYRCKCGNTRLSPYVIFSKLMRGMRWCDPCGRVVRARGVN